LIFSLPQAIFAQEDSLGTCKNTIGIKYSNISGYGIYYNREITENFKLQIMGLVYYLYGLKDNIEHKNLNYDIGLEIQRNILKGQSTRLYFLVGAYYYLDDDKYEGNGTKDYKINHSYNVGVGFAGEYYYHRFIISLDVGYKFFEDRWEITHDAQQYPEIKRVTKRGLGIGIGFMF
jgi:hypothetical protein